MLKLIFLTQYPEAKWDLLFSTWIVTHIFPNIVGSDGQDQRILAALKQTDQDPTRQSRVKTESTQDKQTYQAPVGQNVTCPKFIILAYTSAASVVDADKLCMT